jgi:hypothetical protein
MVGKRKNEKNLNEKSVSNSLIHAFGENKKAHKKYC